MEVLQKNFIYVVIRDYFFEGVKFGQRPTNLAGDSQETWRCYELEPTTERNSMNTFLREELIKHIWKCVVWLRNRSAVGTFSKMGPEG